MSPEELIQIAVGIGAVGTPAKIMHTRLSEIARISSQQTEVLMAMASRVSEVQGEMVTVIKGIQSSISDTQSASMRMVAIDTKLDGLKESVSSMHTRIDNISK
jgi:hypothetical protein